jgi:hypothetical protein
MKNSVMNLTFVAATKKVRDPFGSFVRLSKTFGTGVSMTEPVAVSGGLGGISLGMLTSVGSDNRGLIGGGGGTFDECEGAGDAS